MRLLDPEREVLAAETAAVTARLPEGESRAAYEKTVAAIGAGELDDSQVSLLERLVEAGLDSGRIRAAHGAHAEMAAVAFFHRTPRGRAIREAIDQANEALAALTGSELRRFSFSLRAPGAYTLSLTTDRCQATLAIDRHGVRMLSIEVVG